MIPRLSFPNDDEYALQKYTKCSEIIKTYECRRICDEALRKALYQNVLKGTYYTQYHIVKNNRDFPLMLCSRNDEVLKMMWSIISPSFSDFIGIWEYIFDINNKVEYKELYRFEYNGVSKVFFIKYDYENLYFLCDLSSKSQFICFRQFSRDSDPFVFYKGFMPEFIRLVILVICDYLVFLGVKLY